MNSSFELSYRKNSFLPEGCDHIIPNSVRSSSSDVSLSKFVCPSEKNILFCNLKGIQLLNRLKLVLSHFSKYEITLNFQGTLNPIFQIQ